MRVLIPYMGMFVDNEHLANYADDNTPHTTTKWFGDNYFKLNGDKCKLLVSNNDENSSLVIEFPSL